MKKLKLKALELGAHEILTRTQLKTILGGGFGSGSCDAMNPHCAVISGETGVCISGLCTYGVGGPGGGSGSGSGGGGIGVGTCGESQVRCSCAESGADLGCAANSEECSLACDGT